MINSIEETVTAGLPCDAFIAQVRDELPDDLARSCDFQLLPVCAGAICDFAVFISFIHLLLYGNSTSYCVVIVQLTLW